MRDGGGQDDAPVVVTLTRRARCRHPDITLLCVGFSTEICDAMRCPEHTCQTSIFKYISHAVSSRKRHVKTRSVAHSTSRARLGGRQSSVCSARWRSVRARDSTIVRRILTAQQGMIRQGRLAWCYLPPTSVSPAVVSLPLPAALRRLARRRYVIEDGKRLDTLLKSSLKYQEL